VLGYDKRFAGVDRFGNSRSDTVMLLRADPKTKTVSMLSFPRDMLVDIHCPGHAVYRDRINAAFSLCGPQGTVETVKALTGLPINYLVAVNFRGFVRVVDKLGAAWIDVDRRYLNTHGGPAGFATINLQPGYQLLGGYQALDYVRYRHTDSDIYRVARQQQFVRAFKDQLHARLDPLKVLGLVKDITRNVEVGQGGGHPLSLRTIASWALFAYNLPPGHFFQSKIQGLEGYAELTTPEANVNKAVAQFANPDVASPGKATDVALGVKPKHTAPPPRQTTVNVLNGNGVSGSAANASYSLG